MKMKYKIELLKDRTINMNLQPHEFIITDSGSL